MHLLHFYTTDVRSVLEYACPVWHSRLTVAQAEMIKTVQERVFRMICPNTDYKVALLFAGIEALHDRRETITAKPFNRQVLPAPQFSTTCFLIYVTMKPLANTEIPHLSI